MKKPLKKPPIKRSDAFWASLRSAGLSFPEKPVRQPFEAFAESDMICFFVSALIAMIRQDGNSAALNPHVCELIAGDSAGAERFSVAVAEIDRRACMPTRTKRLSVAIP